MVKQEKTPEQIDEEALALYDEMGDGEDAVEELQKKLMVARAKKKKLEAIREAEAELKALEAEEDDVEEEVEPIVKRTNRNIKSRPSPKQAPKQQSQSKKTGHMRKAWNDCCFQGYTKDDAEMAYSANGNAYTKFTLKIGQGKGKMPIFMKVTTFGDLAEEVNDSIIDGTHVEVLGSLTQRKANNGVYYTEMIADSVIIIEDKQ